VQLRITERDDHLCRPAVLPHESLSRPRVCGEICRAEAGLLLSCALVCAKVFSAVERAFSALDRVMRFGPGSGEGLLVLSVLGAWPRVRAARWPGPVPWPTRELRALSCGHFAAPKADRVISVIRRWAVCGVHGCEQGLLVPTVKSVRRDRKGVRGMTCVDRNDALPMCGAHLRHPTGGLRYGYDFELPPAHPRPRVPDVAGVYERYERAQRVVDYLSDSEFEVQHMAIVGTDLKSVERVIGRLTRGRVAATSAMSGAWMGLFVGLAFAFFGTGNLLGFVVSVVIFGTVFWLVWGQVGFTVLMRGGARDFSSVTQVVASKYEVLIEHRFVERARELLAKMPGGAGLDQGAYPQQGGYGQQPRAVVHAADSR
jgi:hypothetical protein